METQVRRASPSDIETLIDLSRRTISASYRSFLGDAVDAYVDGGAVDRYVQENMDHCTVIARGQHIVGYAVCRENLIDLMMVDHTCHREGLGTALLRHCEEQLLRTHDRLRLESFEANEPANAFYRKNGWLEANRYHDIESGVGKIVFHKPATPSLASS